MTLCAAWIRETEGRELIFATDSRLRVGEKWDRGMKLFDLGRPDCLLCFAGATHRAFTLILQSVALNEIDFSWSYPRLDVDELPERLCTLFTNLCEDIREPSENIHKLRGEAKFLFGGWVWNEERPQVWRIYYDKDKSCFASEPAFTLSDLEVRCVFIGDRVKDARSRLTEKLGAAGGKSTALDMEPFQILARITRDTTDFTTIGGPVQLAKVYGSRRTEFFGVLWPSSDGGSPTLKGQTIDPYTASMVQLLDPDTGELIERFPDTIEFSFKDFSLKLGDFGSEEEFVSRCYPDGELNQSLNRKDRERLARVIKETLYDKVFAELEKQAYIASEDEDSDDEDISGIDLYPDDTDDEV